MERPRLGVVAYWKGYDRKVYLKAARLADELGYDTFFVPEAWGYDIFPLMTEMALATKRIKIATGIVNVFSRTPALLAMSAATMDEISEGRFALGIGTSAYRVIEGFHGRRYEKPLTQTRDVIKIVKTLLRGDSIHEAGAELQQYRPFKLALRNKSRNVPIYVAALKDKAIESAGELADGWMPSFWPIAELGGAIDLFHQGAKRAGRDASKLEVALFTAAFPIGKKAGAGQAKEVVSFYVGGMGDFYRELLSKHGFADDCARITELYRDPATRDKAKAAVPDAMIDAMMVSGDPLTCRARLDLLRNQGVTMPVLGLPPSASYAQVAAFLHAMAPGAKPSPLQLAAAGAIRVADTVQDMF